MHTVARSTKTSFRPKTNNQPLKFSILALSWAKVIKKLDVILGNKVVQKLKFSKNVNYKKCVPKIIFFNEFFFRKIQIFFDVENWLWNFLGGLLLVLGIKEGFVECATVCVKSVVILKDFTIMDQETLMCIMRWTEDEQTPLEFVADNISEVVKLKFEIRMPIVCTYVLLTDFSTDECIKELIKQKWSSGLFWAGGAVEKKTRPNCHK